MSDRYLDLLGETIMAIYWETQFFEVETLSGKRFSFALGEDPSPSCSSRGYFRSELTGVKNLLYQEVLDIGHSSYNDFTCHHWESDCYLWMMTTKGRFQIAVHEANWRATEEHEFCLTLGENCTIKELRENRKNRFGIVEPHSDEIKDDFYKDFHH